MRAVGFRQPTNFASLSSSTFPTPAKKSASFRFAPQRMTRRRAEPAVLVKVQAGDNTRELWLRRADAEHGYQQISTPEGPLAVGYDYQRLPLGFSLKLAEFRHEMNPGLMGDASFASSVRVIDEAHNVDRSTEIAMNQPLVYGGFTFYQSSYGSSADDKPVSVLTVAYDPGRLLKYLGCLMTCLGVCGVFYGKAFSSLLGRLLRRHAGSASGPTAAIVARGILDVGGRSATDACRRGSQCGVRLAPVAIVAGARGRPAETAGYAGRRDFPHDQQQVEFRPSPDARKTRRHRALSHPAFQRKGMGSAGEPPRTFRRRTLPNTARRKSTRHLGSRAAAAYRLGSARARH